MQQQVMLCLPQTNIYFCFLLYNFIILYMSEIIYTEYSKDLIQSIHMSRSHVEGSGGASSGAARQELTSQGGSCHASQQQGRMGSIVGSIVGSWQQHVCQLFTARPAGPVTGQRPLHYPQSAAWQGISDSVTLIGLTLPLSQGKSPLSPCIPQDHFSPPVLQHTHFCMNSGAVLLALSMMLSQVFSLRPSFLKGKVVLQYFQSKLWKHKPQRLK